MALKPYEEVYPPLRVTYRGKTYTLPYVSMSDSDRIAQALDPTAERPDDETIERILLGDAGDEMAADNVPPGFRQRCFMTALAEVRSGRQYAEMVWATAGQPDAIEAWLAENRVLQAPAEAEAATP